MMVGSPGFMAPEQYTDAVLDRRVDVFAAGVLLYYILAGKLPFSGSNEAVMYKVMHELPEPLRPDADGRDFADFWPVVLTALAKQPAQRYGSARAMQEALAGLVRDEPIGRLLAVTCVLPARPDQLAMAGPASPPSQPRTGVPNGPQPTQPVTGSAPPWPTGWNEATLSGLEHDLARHVGPIAKVVVRKAARHFATLEAVRQDVANVITNLVERQHFLQETRALTALAARPAATDLARRSDHAPSRFADSRMPDSRLPDSRPTGTHLGHAAHLDTEALERIGTILTRTIGPIAKVLVRRCAARSSQRDEFVELVLAQLDPRIDREALRRQLLAAL
jgi:serine/threonine-protein kinase